MPDEHGHETAEEAAERVAQVRATQIFGDTPTDPTIGDVVVPAHDEEAANAAAAEVASRAEDGDEEAQDLSREEAKRQLEPLSAEEVDEEAEARADDDGFAVGSDDDADLSDDDDGADDAADDSADESDNLSAEEKIKRIETAESVEEIDALAYGDERVTVQRAADKKRSSL